VQEIIEQLGRGQNLTREQAVNAVGFLLDREPELTAKASLLRALRKKGETADEIAFFAEELLRHAIDPQIDKSRLRGPMIDVCGTGGDRMELFNVSTTSMFVLAAGGAVVAKHGNRGITSSCGGADVLEQLGIEIDFAPAVLRECIQRVGLAFIFAPSYHPAFATIGPVRKLLAAEGRSSVFNLLGPVLNPARPDRQLIGIYSKALLSTYAAALKVLGRKTAWVVHGAGVGEQGLDEISTLGPTDIYALADGHIETFSITPEEFGLSRTTIDQLRGGDRIACAETLVGILEGNIRGAPRDIVVLNAAGGFVVAGLARDLRAGIILALEQLDSGRALEKLRELQSFWAAG
jgi:anthranilate phosphoribosyltransferase